ncbi:SpvB/TcaC N-terminal domain-containing protein [Streptomyces niveus]|uniref:SpvB/TcaC N-terminal domain-containing protein n=1 Tax=Streptomyces niveus TaxID=193462 RepID=UPI00341C686A
MSRFGMRGWVVVLATSVMAGMLSAAPAVVAEPNSGAALSAAKQPPAVPVTKAGIGGAKRADAAASNRWKSPKVTWPEAGSATVDLSGTSASGSGSASAKGAARAAGSLPVSVAAASSATGKPAKPATVKVAVAGRAATDAAGVDGLLLSVAGAGDAEAGPGKARVAVDYSSFRGAYGGDWASRLRLTELPACALTNPQKAACRTGKPLATDNDTASGRLTATVDVARTGATVLAAAAEAAGPSGDYKATSLQPSGTWSAGGSTGAFNWSYPIGVPAVPGGLQPSVGLGYNSQTVDGRTAASNNQPSWIGDGWSYEPGYIERRYKACNDDKTDGTNTTKVGDLCWYNDNAVLNLGGKSTELVHDSEKGWHPAQDAGEKVEKLTGADNADKGTAGAKGEGGAGEHWKITTTDGTQYFFGLNKLPGWSDNGAAADDPLTNSVLTTPVFGNQSGEPCYDASFASAWCQQAYRWQLDYVVDVRGNAMTYHWKTEQNNYGRNVSETTGNSTATSYLRAGYLDRIDYGLRAGSLFSAKAAGQVHFGVEERCLADCGTFDAAHAKNWPDVPFDQHCKDDAECKDQYSPTFWSKKRLTSITTKVLTGGAYKDVDSWSLKQGFPATGDGIYPDVAGVDHPYRQGGRQQRAAPGDVRRPAEAQPRRQTRRRPRPVHPAARLPDHHRVRRHDRRRLPGPRLHRHQPAADRRLQQHPLLPGQVGLRRRHRQAGLVQLVRRAAGLRGRQPGVDTGHRHRVRLPRRRRMGQEHRRVHQGRRPYVLPLARLRAGADPQGRRRRHPAPERDALLPRHRRRRGEELRGHRRHRPGAVRRGAARERHLQRGRRPAGQRGVLHPVAFGEDRHPCPHRAAGPGGVPLRHGGGGDPYHRRGRHPHHPHHPRLRRVRHGHQRLGAR